MSSSDLQKQADRQDFQTIFNAIKNAPTDSHLWERKSQQIDRQRSCEDFMMGESFHHNGSASSQFLECLKTTESPEMVSSPSKRPTSNASWVFHASLNQNHVVNEAWEMLRKSVVYFQGNMVGTVAALDQSVDTLNYDQVHILSILL